MRTAVTFVVRVDGAEQARWTETVRARADMTVVKFGRRHDIVEGVATIEYRQKCPDVQSVANYRRMREMEDRLRVRVGDINSWDFIDSHLLRREGGSWHRPKTDR